MLTATPLPTGSPFFAHVAPLETSLVLEVDRSEWRRWREPLGLRHGLRLWDEAGTVAHNMGAPLRSPHCEGALWRTWMDWIADTPLCVSRRHTA